MNSGKSKILKEVDLGSKERSEFSYLGYLDYIIKSYQNTQNDLQPCPFASSL